MPKEIIVAIDSDVIFLERLRYILADLAVFETYDYVPIEVRVARQEDVAEYCSMKIRELLVEHRSIDLVLVDIVIIEREELPLDRSGLDIARQLTPLLPGVPILGVTRFHKSHRLLSEISLDFHLHGVLLKAFLESAEFSRRDLLEFISKARQKAAAMVGAPGTATVRTTRGAEEPFQPSDDPRLRHQLECIEKTNVQLLLKDLFPSSHGTIKYMRPGFSGSYLFNVSVRNDADGTLASHTETW